MKRISQTSTDLKSWYILCALSLLSYLPFIFNFLWGNHDWGWVKDHTPLLSGVFEGRFSQFILPIILFEGNILPVLSITISIFLYGTAATILLKLLDAPKTSLIFILLGLNIVTAPYTLSWLYFAFLILSCLSWPLIIIIGFWLLQTKLTAKIKISVSIILFTLALGGYPPVINMIGVILCILALNDLCLKKLSVKTLICKYLPHLVAIVISIILLFTIQHLLKQHHWQYDTYNTAGITLETLKEKLPPALTNAFQQFIITNSFINYGYKYLSLCLILSALLELLKNLPKRTTNILAFIILISGILISTIATLVVAQNERYVRYEPRIEFFSLPYIYTFAATVLYKSSIRFLKNITFIILLILFFLNLTNNAYASKVWKLGFLAENNFSERFISRLENNQNFTPQKNKYTFVQGGTFNLRKRYYISAPTNSEDSYTLLAPYIPWHLPYKAYTFYYPYAFVEKDFDVYWSYISPFEIPFSQELENYIKNLATPWPQPNAVFIKDTLIILTLTYEGRGRAVNWLNKYY